jgi:hypothetical protein
MTANKDWLPSREQDLVELMAIWQTKLANAATQTAYGWVATECTATIATITAFTTARSTYQTAPTHANQLVKESAKKAAIAALRKFAAERIRNNPKMNEGQREELGVPTRDPEPTPVPVPKNGPESVTATSSHAPGLVEIRYLEAKPYGVDLVEIAWSASDAPIDDPAALPHTDTFAHNPWRHTFAGADRGRKLYYSLRYVTKEGKSAWTEVKEVIVP